MNNAARRDEIVALAGRQGFVSIEMLAKRFDVTPQTIRRDINGLCDAGLLQRYHGGAGPASSVRNVAYSARKELESDAKLRIARLVASHVPNDCSLFINIGTTTEAVAQALTSHTGLSVITNNLNVAAFLSANTPFEVVVAGGVVRNRDGGIIGEATIDFINQFRVDIGIIGISGIDLDGALLDFDYREVRVAQAIIRNARRVFLAADHSKFGRSAMVRLDDIGAVDSLFTDQAPPEPLAEALRAQDVALHIAP